MQVREENPVEPERVTRVRDLMVEDPATVNVSDDLALALQIMLWKDIRHLPVLEDGRVVGVISERDILAGRLEEESFYRPTRRPVSDVMSAPARFAHPNQDAAEAAAMMAVDKLGCLPVVDAGRLVGIITAIDLLSDAAQCRLPVRVGPDTLVEDIMTTSVVAVRADDHVADAAAAMVQAGVRHLPVIDVLDRLVGILSERDVRSAIGNPLSTVQEPGVSARADELLVSDVMTGEPRTLRPDESIAEVVAAFLDERFGALPVVDEEDGGRLLGIVSYIDVFRALAESWESAS